ncbi:MAG: flippase-like domain-containing protein [Bacteroidaceae bacterium]|nr:flippase-like domain-containing protein [Bacteroidaceae bacterium]
MLFTFDVSFAELWQHLIHAGYWLIPIIGVWVVIYGINALAWLTIIRATATPGEMQALAAARGGAFMRIFRLTVTGYALNYATPVGGLGGEPYRIMELSKNISTQHATSSVILYAMMHVFAHFWFWFTSIFLYLALAAVGDLPLPPLMATLFAMAIVFCLTAFYLFWRGYRKGLVVKTIRGIGHIPGLGNWSRRFLKAHEEALHNVDKQIAALHQTDKRAFYTSFMLEYLSRIVQSTEILFMLLLFGIDGGGDCAGIALTFLHAVLILSFTTLLANLIGFLPMQLGVQEGGFVISIAALGLSAALGIFVSIICRVREIIWIFVGILLMKLPDSRRRAT